MARAKPVEIGDMRFSKKGEALDYLRSVLNKYSPEDRVSAEDEHFLLQALARHPDAIEKAGVGVDYLFVRTADYGTKCFWVRRTDGSEERFSYKSCV